MTLRRKLSYANVVSTVALVVAVSGGVAYGASYLVSKNSQVGPGVIAGHAPPTGKHANIIAASITTKDIAAGTIQASNVQGGLPCVIRETTTISGGSGCQLLELVGKGPGSYCYTVTPAPTGVFVSIDAGSAGYPVAFTSTTPAEISAVGCPTGTDALIQTYSGAGGSLQDEDFTAIFY